MNSILSGVIAGLLSSGLIFWFWQFQKPSLSFSSKIAKNSSGEYRIKIVNNSNRYVRNVAFKLQTVTLLNGDGGQILSTHNLDMPYPELFFIEPRSKKSSNAEYAVRIILPLDLESHWVNDEHTYLKLLVFCSNEYNTSSKVYKQCYHKKTCIENGEFAYGDSFEIVPES